MSTPSYARTWCIDRCKSPAVANAAGVSIADWQSTTRPRVVSRETIGSVNRGRFPMVTVGISNNAYGDDMTGGGEVASTIEIVLHVGGTQAAASATLEAMAAAINSSIRDYDDRYAALGIDNWEQVTIGPLHHTLTLSLLSSNTYNTDTYEA